MNKLIRYITGYIIGFFIFLILIPFFIFKLSEISNSITLFNFKNSINIQIIISLPFFFIGVIFMIWSNISLLFKGKGGPADGFGIAISPRTKKLVISGPYKYTRNPMVFGALFIYIALSIFFNSTICLISIIMLSIFVVIYLKLTEEKRLLKEFGNEFIQYKKKVAMIIPFMKFKKK